MPIAGTRFAPVEEMIHGVLVRDPYRWLEDRSLPETEDWLRHQQEIRGTYLAGCNDLGKIRERVEMHLDVEAVDQPCRVGSRYFYRRRNQGQEQSCIYVRDGAIDRVLVDPGTEGSFVSVGIHRISTDGSLLAFDRRHGGEDRKSIHLVEVVSGAVLSDHLDRGYARGFVFASDNRGYFYCHDSSSNANEHTIRLHLFHKSGEDQVVFRKARSDGSRLVLTADHVHLGAIWINEVNGELLEDLWVANRRQPFEWHNVFSMKRLPFSPILKAGRVFALTQEAGSEWRVVELDTNGHELGDVFPKQPGVLRQLAFRNKRIFASFFQGMEFLLKSWSLDGEELLDVPLPAHGTVDLLTCPGDESSLFVSFESFALPPRLLEYDVHTNQLDTWHARPATNRADAYRIVDNAYAAADGVTIPLTLLSSETAHQPAPAIMTSYGGFGVPMTPRFSVLVTILLELGVVFAVPHIRGGGEFGRTWHEAGRGRNRQVSFDDFLSAVHWLFNEGVTTSEQLAIFGGSNSGLLVGVAITQRPNLFRAALCVAPLLDMVRYEHFANVAKWRSEYGTVHSQEEFAVLHGYSPYHRIAEGVDYPATLFVTGDCDERCDSAHVRKMAARLQERSAQRRPIIVDFCAERGHSPVLPLSVRINALSLRIAFLCRELRIPVRFGDHHETVHS